jgi:hypothetical protein
LQKRNLYKLWFKLQRPEIQIFYCQHKFTYLGILSTVSIFLSFAEGFNLCVNQIFVFRLCSLGSQCSMASYNFNTNLCTYVPHFSLKSLSIRDFLVAKSNINTYILECEPVLNTNLMANSDLFTQSAAGWTVMSTCSVGSNVGRADHRYSPSSFKSHVAGYQYSWMAQGRRIHKQ